MSDLGDLSLCEAALAVRRREVSPVELTEHYLGRIEATEGAVHAYVTVDAAGARAQARAAEAALGGDNADLGALHGVPLGIKDLIDTAGVRTTYGSRAWQDHVPRLDASVVSRLRRAHAVILGKHATHELAWGGRTDSAHFGPTHNPHRRGYIAGGSSGGSAASVAVGSSLGALGTDTAGSVRIPAALSGCVGYKPSRGRVSRWGVLPLAPSLDHVGALARTVADAAAIVAAVAGSDPADPATLAGVVEPAGPVADLSIAFLGGWPAAGLSAGVVSRLETVQDGLVAAGSTVAEAELPGPAPTEAVLLRVLAEAGARHRPLFEERPELFGADLAALLRLPVPTPGRMAAAQALAARAEADLLEVLTRHDTVVLATVPVTAPRIGSDMVELGDGSQVPVELALTRLTSLANAAGLPAISVPAGDVAGLPVGIQVIGRPGGDAVVEVVAAAIETQAARAATGERGTGASVGTDQ